MYFKSSDLVGLLKCHVNVLTAVDKASYKNRIVPPKSVLISTTSFFLSKWKLKPSLPSNLAAFVLQAAVFEHGYRQMSTISYSLTLRRMLVISFCCHL